VGSTIPGLRLSGTAVMRGCCLSLGFDQPCCWSVGYLGHSIRPAGDFDGDGFDDMLVTADELWPKRVYLIRGAARPPAVLDLAEADTLDNVITFQGPVDNRGFALRDAMVGLGDLNGDGLDDIALGLSRVCCPWTLPDDGAVYIFYGRADFPRLIDFAVLSEDQYSVVIPSPQPYSLFGSSVAGGDLNQDGVPDLLIGAPRVAVDGKFNAGEAYAVFGRFDLPKVLSLEGGFDGIRVVGENFYNALGEDVSYVGDFNGDRHPDFLVSAPHLSDDYPGPGRAYVIYGTSPGPQPLKLHRVAPSAGPLRGGTKVLLSGGGFDGAAEVYFGNQPAVGITLVSRSQLSVLSPAGTGLGAVDVTVRVGGESQALTQAFEYTPNFPAIDLDDLDGRGFILEGLLGRIFSWPAISAIAFGDLTGDAIDDLIAEASFSHGLTVNGWTVTVVRGGPDVPAQLPAFEPSERVTTITSFEFRSTEGATVALVGDANQGGRVDLAIGASDGVGYLMFGEEGLPPGTLDIDAAVLAGSAVRFERSVEIETASMYVFAPVGDLTGDGIDDFAVGFSGAGVEPPDSPLPGPRAGEIVFVAGRGSWPEGFDLSDPGLRLSRLHGGRAGQRFAARLRQVGDVNGDGVVDLLADSVAVQGRGRAYLLYGRTDLPASAEVESWVSAGGGMIIDLLDGFRHFDWFNVAPAGDVDADGYADILLGVEGGGDMHHGVTYLIYGGEGLPELLELREEPAEPDRVVRIFGEGVMEQAGRAGPAGDFNGDGHGDLVIGAPGFQAFGSEAGNVFLIFGGGSLPGKIDLRRIGAYGLKIDGRNILGGAGF
ncbi:MAG: IPT/TIG domain-containing protein, partial [Anaerolineales bacterium]